MDDILNNMKIENIVFLDDIFRDTFIHSRRFIYTVLAEPICQALNVEVLDTFSYPSNRGLINNFDEKEFKRLVGVDEWNLIYKKINAKAENYL